MFKVKFYRTLMARNGLLAEAYLPQGRMPKSVFARHCLKENIKEFKARIILSLEKLKIAFFYETNV
jgi:hypothetical protein